MTEGNTVAGPTAGAGGSWRASRAAGRRAAGVMRYAWAHPSNQGRRPQAVLGVIRFQFRGRVLGLRTPARLGERSRIWVDLHRAAATMVLYANPPDRPEMLAWRRALRPGDLFVDVGANIGSYTIWAAELGAEVIALEPAPDTYGLLEENVALNGYDVRMLRAAAGASCGTVGFSAGLDAGNRLDPDGPVQASMITIDSVIGDRTVAGMKVDVEGFEIEVLRGCARALAEHRIRIIQLEWNAMSKVAVGTSRQPVAELLAAAGYCLYRPDATGSLVPCARTGYGSDMFACPGPAGPVVS